VRHVDAGDKGDPFLTFTLLRRAPFDAPDTELVLRIAAVFCLAKGFSSFVALFDVQGRWVLSLNKPMARLPSSPSPR
jgi:hypothetical protein